MQALMTINRAALAVERSRQRYFTRGSGIPGASLRIYFSSKTRNNRGKN